MPPSTRSASPLRNAVTDACAGRAPSVTSSRSTEPSSRFSIVRSSSSGSGLLCGVTTSGPVPWPSRTIAISGWARSCKRCGRGAVRLISSTRSVIGTIWSIAPSVSFSTLSLRDAICRRSSRATCWAVSLLPSGHSVDCSRKM